MCIGLGLHTPRIPTSFSNTIKYCIRSQKHPGKRDGICVTIKLSDLNKHNNLHLLIPATAGRALYHKDIGK